MRTTFSTALVFTLLAVTGNAIDLGRRQGSPLSVSSSTTSATAPTVSSPGPVQQGLVFTTPVDVTTCGSANIIWSYTGSTTDLLTLAITDAGVNQTNVDPPPPITVLSLGTDIDPSLDLYTWTPVNLSAGYYVVLGAIGGGSTVQSDVFLISTGSDTSCITTSSTTSSSSSSVISTSATSTITPSSTSSSTPVPVSSSKKSNVGAIAGGVVAGIVALLVLAFIGMMFMRRRNKAARARRFSSPGDSFSRAKPTNTARHHGPSESTGGMLTDIGPAIATAAEAQSSEDLYSVAEKDMSGSPGKDSIAQLSYTGGNHHRSSSSSTLNHQPITARTSLSLSRASPPNGRRPSLDVTGYVQSERSSSAPGAPRPFSPRTAAVTAAELIPMGRSSSGQSRRASRKPVPQYDASELQATPSEQSLPMPSPSQTGAVSGLRHQSSSGDVRPVHYLIPDLPPPGQY